MAMCLIHMIFYFQLAFAFETKHRDNALKFLCELLLQYKSQTLLKIQYHILMKTETASLITVVLNLNILEEMR